MGCCIVGMVMSAIVFIVISLEYDLDNMLEKINDDHTIMKMLVMMRIRSWRRGRTMLLRRKGWWVVEMAEIT